ncbi:MAG: GNAT family N-acetyltransferase [Flavobacteriaceae bacterium]
MQIIIETERLILREMVMADARDMLRLYSIPEVQKYTGEDVITNLEGIHQIIKEKINDYELYGYGRWVAILKDGQQFIGWAGLAYLPEFGEIDLGYRFLPEYWGAGFATEASKAILNYGFNKLKLEKIIAIAMKENKASIRVMEKAGMQFDKFAPYEPGGEDFVWYWCDQKLIKKN